MDEEAQLRRKAEELLKTFLCTLLNRNHKRNYTLDRCKP